MPVRKKNQRCLQTARSNGRVFESDISIFVRVVKVYAAIVFILVGLDPRKLFAVSLECLLLVGLDPWRLFIGSLHLFFGIPDLEGFLLVVDLDPWSVLSYVI